MVTRSPARTRIRFRRNRPARWASTTRSWSSWTLNRPLGNFSKTTPVTSILSSLLIQPSFLTPYRAGKPSITTGRPAFSGPLLFFGSGAHSDVCSLQAFRSARHFEFYSGAFIETSITLRLNCREVYEYVFTVLSLNEAIPFGCIEPLHCTFFFHLCFLFLVMQLPFCARPSGKKQKGVAAGMDRQPPSNLFVSECKSQTRY